MEQTGNPGMKTKEWCKETMEKKGNPGAVLKPRSAMKKPGNRKETLEQYEPYQNGNP